MAGQKIRIKLKAYDHRLIDQSTEKIIKTAKTTGAMISGQSHCPLVDQCIRLTDHLTLIKNLASSLKLEFIKDWSIFSTPPQKRLMR